MGVEMILDTVIYGTITLWSVIFFTTVIILAVIVAKIVTLNLKKGLSDKVKKTDLDILLKVTYYTIVLLAVVIALPALDIELSGLLVAGGFAGLVVGFASQSVVSNLVSGLFLIIERPVKIGDEIGIGDIGGYVEDIRFLSTIVRKYDGVSARIPNEKVFTSNITNYVANAVRRVEYTVGISYDSDANRAIEGIRMVLNAHPFVLQRPDSEIFINALAESSIDIKVKFWVPSTRWYRMQSELLGAIRMQLEKDGVKIPFPQRTIWFAGAGSPGTTETDARQQVSSAPSSLTIAPPLLTESPESRLLP
jgi:small-conductance mechanosensitive channel